MPEEADSEQSGEGWPPPPDADPEDAARVKRIRKYAVAMQIRGLGEKLARTLVAEGLVTGPADLYGLKAESVACLRTVRTFGAQNAANLNRRHRGIQEALTWPACCSG